MCSSRYVSLSMALLLWSGCDSRAPAPAPAPSPAGYGGYGDYGYDQEINFLGEAPANTTTEVGLSDLAFTTPTGETTHVRDLAGPKGTVVVVTRGNTNPICPYCSTQTAHYIRNYDEFRSRGVEVLIVYPIEVKADNDRLTAFLNDARGRIGDAQRPVPFPVLFDVELTAVDQLGIRKDLAKPATYIVNAAGEVTYAYVGAHMGDRPAVVAVLSELNQQGITPVQDAAAPGPGSAAPHVTDPAAPAPLPVDPPAAPQS